MPPTPEITESLEPCIFPQGPYSPAQRSPIAGSYKYEKHLILLSGVPGVERFLYDVLFSLLYWTFHYNYVIYNYIFVRGSRNYGRSISFQPYKKPQNRFNKIYSNAWKSEKSYRNPKSES